MNSSACVRSCPTGCPGCHRLYIDPIESAQRKSEWIGRILARWSAVTAPLVAPVESARSGYRDRALLHCGWQEGAWAIGLWRRDRVIDIVRCPVHSERLAATLSVLTGRLPPADQLPLRYLLLNGRQLTLVVKQAQCAWRPQSWLIGALERCGVEGIWLHLNPSSGRHRPLHSSQWRLIHGEPRSFGPGGLCHGPTSFLQTTGELHRQSVELASGWLNPHPAAAVIDLYSGVGPTLREWRRCGAETIGVEASGESIGCAAINAPGATLLQGYCETRIPQLEQWLDRRPRQRPLCYLNPPRGGSGPQMVAWLTRRAKPVRIACLSCNATSLAHDLAGLEQGGYRVESIRPFDLFPRTDHVETLALLRSVQ